MGFERNYQLRIPSKQENNIKMDYINLNTRFTCFYGVAFFLSVLNINHLVYTCLINLTAMYGQMSHWGCFDCLKCLFNNLFLLFLYLDEYTFHLFNFIYSDPY